MKSELRPGAKKPTTSKHPLHQQTSTVLNRKAKISESRWLLIEDRLRELVSLGEEPKRLQFGSATIYKGVKVICSKNEGSKDYPITTVAALYGLWEGSELGLLT